jgi:hypothetical protein
MKSQIDFLTPVISGIVVGITSMISTIIGKLGTQLQQATAGGQAQATAIVGIFGDTIPTYYFQLIVGFYVVQIIYILTILSNGIENGEDKLNEEYTLGQGMTRSCILYTVVSLVVILIFNIIATSVTGTPVS